MIRSNKFYAWIIGIGIVLFAIHNVDQPLITYTFLPAIGMLLLSIGIVMYIVNNWRLVSLGSKYIYIPLLIIVASIIGSSIVQMVSNSELTLFEGFSPIVFGLLLFGLYVVSRSIDREIFTPFTYAVVIGALGCIVWGIVNPGVPSGGYIISPPNDAGTGNYDIATGLLVFGTIVSAIKYQWWLAAIALVGLFFTGSPEFVFVIAVLGIIVLARRDWGKKLIPIAGVLGILVVIMLTGFGKADTLYAYTGDKIGSVVANPTSESVVDDALTGRWGRIKLAMSNIKPLGEGYTITDFTTYTVHNVPLVIVQQIGIVAAIAWLWVTIFCLVKTKWKYAWSAVIALSVFDHFIWTQVGVWWWALAGVSTASSIKSDLIFKRTI